MRIVDIYYQSLDQKEAGFIRPAITYEDIKKETQKLLSEGWQPFYAPVIGRVDSTMSFWPVFFQTWVKYE